MKLFLRIKFILIILLPFLPVVVLAALVPCGGRVDDLSTAWDETEACGFSHLIILINIIINFLLITLAVPIAAIMFAVSGFILMTAGGDPGKISRAKEIFGSVLWGFLIAFLAWIIVQTLLLAAGLDPSYSYLS